MWERLRELSACSAGQSFVLLSTTLDWKREKHKNVDKTRGAAHKRARKENHSLCCWTHRASAKINFCQVHWNFSLFFRLSSTIFFQPFAAAWCLSPLPCHRESSFRVCIHLTCLFQSFSAEERIRIADEVSPELIERWINFGVFIFFSAFLQNFWRTTSFWVLTGAPIHMWTHHVRTKFHEIYLRSKLNKKYFFLVFQRFLVGRFTIWYRSDWSQSQRKTFIYFYSVSGCSHLKLIGHRIRVREQQLAQECVMSRPNGPVRYIHKRYVAPLKKSQILSQGKIC